jgi:hypothetical protein
MHNARSFADGRSIPPLCILYAFMVCREISALVLHIQQSLWQEPFLQSYPFTSYSRHSQHFTVPKKFYNIDNTTMTVWVRAQFTTCYTFALLYLVVSFWSHDGPNPSPSKNTKYAGIEILTCICLTARYFVWPWSPHKFVTSRCGRVGKQRK